MDFYFRRVDFAFFLKSMAGYDAYIDFLKNPYIIENR
ncbi:Uncharacterised protein [Prevotella nigrescens]|nr:Uncharacterised protein [Prevotella nigrescens]